MKHDKKNIASKHNKVKDGLWHLEVFARSVKVDTGMKYPAPSGGLRGEIKSFTRASQRRLKFNAGNAYPELISQFSMTYHYNFPQGRLLKAQLNLFLTQFRKRWKSGYLWILEFQTRKAPHIHLFLTLPYDAEGLHEWLAKTWNHIVEPGNEKHLEVHRHEKNFIAWSMGSGAYLCKYLSKQAQKEVPPGFEGVGRFWGSSRGLVSKPAVVTPEMINSNYPEKPAKVILRSIHKHHESQCKMYGRKSRAKNKRGRYLIPNGAVVFEKCVEYYDKRLDDDIPF